MKDISDILPSGEKLEGEKTDKDELKDKKLVITAFALIPSSYEGKDSFAVVQAKYNNKLITFAGGEVITKQMQAIGLDNFPVTAKLTFVTSGKGRGYWSLVSSKEK